MRIATLIAALCSALFVAIPQVWAHHVLGRPSYSLNEDSNTPPSMQLEIQIGNYLVAIMAFPAFPKVGEESRIKLYASHLDSGAPFPGKVTFSIRDAGWFEGNAETLGVQIPIDGIFRQAMVFGQEGHYIISASFEAAGEPYIIDMPIQIGNPVSHTPLLLTVGAIVLILLVLSWRKRALRQDLEAKTDRVRNRSTNP